jgi:hypothetical protein
LGRGHARAEPFRPGRRHARRRARGLGAGHHRDHAPALRGVQPAPHGSAMPPEAVRHLAASAGLLGREEIQRW